jgi:tetratricopeptide (TPR) repeat protein
VVLVLAFLGPAQAAGGPYQSDYGINSRAELFQRGVYFLLDFPITGGGLNSFPGLYSHYMLRIPNFYFSNSYNTFLDAAIEQGITGGLVLLSIYLGTIWLVSQTVMFTPSHRMRFLGWLSLFALAFTVIHGFFYDYLYNGVGTFFLFFPIGFSMIAVMDFMRSGYKFTGIIEQSSKTEKIYSPLLVLLPVLGIMTILVLNRNKIISMWYSNMGAVQMSKVELRYFPANQWTTDNIIPELEMAESSLRSAVQYDPYNRTANYRLGMISMLRQDFYAASIYLKAAYDQIPRHRGVVKNLGFSYVWLGNPDKAKVLLQQIPEAQEELNAYAWWWGIQGRSDLSANSSTFAAKLGNIHH